MMIKHKNMNAKLLFFALLAQTLLFSACNQDEYLIDTGIHKAQYDGTVLQYLESKPDYFSDLLEVANLAGMDEALSNDTLTFFAPPNEAIRKTVNFLNEILKTQGKDTVAEYSQIDPRVWKDVLSLYVFDGKYLLKDYPQLDTLDIPSFPGQGYISHANRIMNVGVIYNDANGVEYAGYRQLVLSYIPDVLYPTQNWINVPIASSNIQPKNGVVHVLNYSRHFFGFDFVAFYQKAVSYGIKPVDDGEVKEQE